MYAPDGGVRVDGYGGYSTGQLIIGFEEQTMNTIAQFENPSNGRPNVGYEMMSSGGGYDIMQGSNDSAGFETNLHRNEYQGSIDQRYQLEPQTEIDRNNVFYEENTQIPYRR
jgi:hypothetical protein